MAGEFTSWYDVREADYELSLPEAPAHEPPVKPWLVGLWNRVYINQSFRAHKPVDDGQVYYLQGPLLCVDMRIPPSLVEAKQQGRFRGRVSLEEYTVEELDLLAQQECFAGCTRVATSGHGEEIVEWRPLFEFPAGGAASEASDWVSARDGTCATDDVGLVVGREGDARWKEVDVETRGSKLTELWERVPQSSHETCAAVTHMQKGQCVVSGIAVG